MKKRKMVFLLAAAVFGGSLCAACGSEKQPQGDGDFTLPNAPAGSLPEGVEGLAANGFVLEFTGEKGNYGVHIIDGNGTESFFNDKPAMLNVRGPALSLLGTYQEVTYSSAYSTLKKQSYGYFASAEVETEDGAKVLFEDAYYISSAGELALERRATVTAESSQDEGFETVFSLKESGKAASADGFEFCVPAILYKDTANMVSGAIGSNLGVDKMYVKETRTGIPMAMLRKAASGASVALAHLKPKIDAGTAPGSGFNGAVNIDLQYGSVGFGIRNGVSVDFCYPCAEGPTTYDSGAGWSRVYHPMTKDTAHEYGLAIVPAAEESYASAMTRSTRAAYLAAAPEIADDVDIDAVYDDNIKVFSDTYREFGTEIVAAGVPWAIRIDDGTAESYTFQMGFVGQQIPVGYHLLRSGYENNDPELIRKGKTIVNFWTSPTIMGGALPIVWWDPSNTASAGSSRGYPCFLRCFVDGAEGMLDAYRIARDNGEEMTAWRNAVVKIADFLAGHQNANGSFYRAYNTDGTVCTDFSNPAYQGTSELNTPVAVRFLAKMYELTGEEKYKTAALSAAEYSYTQLYLGKEKYVGGTPDNPNTVDKEASTYAMYCFDAAYTLTKDAKYLAAAEHAAMSFLGWVYCYDFACPSSVTVSRSNPFANGGVSGFSLIATGHSGADNFSAYAYYEFFRLYVFTGDDFYLEAAKFLQNNTKLSTDYDGRMGWKWRAIGPEASRVCEFNFTTVGSWLPWSGIANIEPIGNMRSAFGVSDVADIQEDLPALAVKLAAYGVGGK